MNYAEMDEFFSGDDTEYETTQCDVVEWPRLSQAVRLEREAATCYYSVCTEAGAEVAIFYTWEAAGRFCSRYDYPAFSRKNILREMP